MAINNLTFSMVLGSDLVLERLNHSGVVESGNRIGIEKWSWCAFLLDGLRHEWLLRYHLDVLGA